MPITPELRRIVPESEDPIAFAVHAIERLSRAMQEAVPRTRPIETVSLAVVDLTADPGWKLHVFSDTNPNGGDHFEYPSESRYFTVAVHPDGRALVLGVRRANSMLEAVNNMYRQESVPLLGVDSSLTNNGLAIHQDGTQVLNISKLIPGGLDVGVIIGNNEVTQVFLQAADQVLLEVKQYPFDKDSKTCSPIHLVISNIGGEWVVNQASTEDLVSVNWVSCHDLLKSQEIPVSSMQRPSSTS